MTDLRSNVGHRGLVATPTQVQQHVQRNPNRSTGCMDVACAGGSTERVSVGPSFIGKAAFTHIVWYPASAFKQMRVNFGGPCANFLWLHVGGELTRVCGGVSG